MTLKLFAHIEWEDKRSNPGFWTEYARVKIDGDYNRIVLFGSNDTKIEPIFPLRGFPDDLSLDIVSEYGLRILDTNKSNLSYEIYIHRDEAQKRMNQQPSQWHFTHNEQYIISGINPSYLYQKELRKVSQRLWVITGEGATYSSVIADAGQLFQTASLAMYTIEENSAWRSRLVFWLK